MAGPTARVAAQAKVNLFLHVLAREQSGYHQLETLFCRLTLADEVVVRVARGWRIDCDGADTGPAEHNLAYRAARLYAAERRWPDGCAIEIAKHIPVGAGLGGGSADAGAVLRCLAALDPDPPTTADLLRWGAQLGADVPFLTLDAALALGYGRGERLLVLRPLPPMPVVLYVPRTPIATRDAYAWLAAWRTDHGLDGLRATPRAVDVGSLERWHAIEPLMANDFTPVAAERHPEIGRATSAMRALPGARASLLSGSGAAVFCVFDAPPPTPWPIVAEQGSRFLQTATADEVAPVQRLE